MESTLKVKEIYLISASYANLLYNFEQLANWHDLIPAFASSISPSSASMSIITTINTAINEAGQLNQHVAVLKNLISCKKAASTLINIQMVVLGLNHMLNGVSELM